MARYRGQVQGGKGHQQAAGTGPAAKSTMSTGAKRQQKRKLSDAEEDDLTSSNGHSGSEGKTGIPSVNRVNLRKPGYRNHHGGATGRQKSFTFNKLLSTCGISTIVAFVAYYGYLGYLETRISTPLQVDKVVVRAGLDIPERFWGSYRPGVYFGMKHRSPKSLLTGFMWLLPSLVRPGEPNLRHLCEQGDGLTKYGWVEHDGVNFGVQEIIDHHMKLTTSFVKAHHGKKGGDWTSRIEVQPLATTNHPQSTTKEEVVLLYYVALEAGMGGNLVPEYYGDILKSVEGYTPELGKFTIKFINNNNVLKSSFIQTSLDSMTAASNTVLSSMATTSVSEKQWLFFLKNRNQPDSNPQNFLVYQVHVRVTLVWTLYTSLKPGSSLSRNFYLGTCTAKCCNRTDK